MVVDLVRAGNYIRPIATYVGVSHSTLYDWMKRGQAAIDAADEADALEWEEGTKGEDVLVYDGIPELERPYAKFFIEVTKASQEAEVRSVTAWSVATRTDWRAAKEFLARRFPDRWGENPVEITLTGELRPAGTTSQEIPVTNDDERAATIAAILEEAGVVPAGLVAGAVEEGADAPEDEVLPEDADT